MITMSPRDLKRQTEFLERQTACAGYPFGGTFSAQDVGYERINAKITAVDSGSPANYSWTEQLFDTTGAYIDMPGGRSGTASIMPARERNGLLAMSFPFYAELKSRVLVNGLPIYEFSLAGGGVGGGLSMVALSDTTPDSDGLYTGAAYQYNQATNSWSNGADVFYANPAGQALANSADRLGTLLASSFNDGSNTYPLYADATTYAAYGTEGIVFVGTVGANQFFGNGAKLADELGTPEFDFYRPGDWPVTTQPLAASFTFASLTFVAGGHLTGFFCTTPYYVDSAGFAFGYYNGTKRDTFGHSLFGDMLFHCATSPASGISGVAPVYACTAPSGATVFGGTGSTGLMGWTSGLFTTLETSAAGAIEVCFSTNRPNSLAIGTTGQVLTVNSGHFPAWM